MTGSALFLSPHLDDVAFSCGGTLIRLVKSGWRTALCTLFTASVEKPQGFALACQLDKGLTADADYMALRRAEDRHFAELAGVQDCHHLSFPEAPHRGYASAPDLFAGMHQDDRIWEALAAEISRRTNSFEWIFAPQGLGNHVDHLQTIRAVHAAALGRRVVWYRDTPYAIRYPEAEHSRLLPVGLQPDSCLIDLPRKIAACAAYTTQVPFQFGSAAIMAQKLERFHFTTAGYAESFFRSTEAKTSPFQSRTMTRGI